MVWWDNLIDDEFTILQHVHMGYLLYAPYVWVDKELLIALMERWSERTNTFHLAIKEIIIIL